MWGATLVHTLLQQGDSSGVDDANGFNRLREAVETANYC